MMDIKDLVKGTRITAGSKFEQPWKELVTKAGLRFESLPIGYICRDEDCSLTVLLTEFDSDYIRENFPNLEDFLESGKRLRNGDFVLDTFGIVEIIEDEASWNYHESYDGKRYVIFSKSFLDEPEPEPEIAGVDRDGFEWTKGLVMVRDYDDQKWLPEVLISVEPVETAQYLTKSITPGGIRWKRCRLPTAEELRTAMCERKYSKVELAAYELYRMAYPDSETAISDAVKYEVLIPYKRQAIALNYDNCND